MVRIIGDFAALFDDNVLTMGRVDKKELMTTCQGCDCDLVTEFKTMMEVYEPACALNVLS